MQITFSLPHVFFAGSPQQQDKHARRILDECVGQLNRPYRNSRSKPSLYEVGTRNVVFTLPSVFKPGATIEENSYALKQLLDCLIEFNLLFLANQRCQSLYKSGVYYKRTEIWDSIPAMYERGYGDCKSLTTAYVAQHRANGLDCTPCFRWITRPDGSKAVDYHILVQLPNGRFTDPSKVCGMGSNENGPV